MAARRFFPNDEDAEEAAQDALLSVAQHIDSFAGRSRYTTWLHRITTNACIDLYRRLKRHASERLATDMEPAARGSSPSVRVGARIDLLDAAEKMDDRLIESVLMRDLLELPYGEIAGLHDVPEGTVRGRVSEGRKELRRLLATGS